VTIKIRTVVQIEERIAAADFVALVDLVEDEHPELRDELK